MAEFDSKTQLSGLAGEIRASISSEQFDLAGYTEVRAIDLMTSAFGSPLTEPKQMVKFQFVVGGGKLVRSKYNDDMSKWIISALRDLGYTEDRSAAETFDSQGTFKQQHDTGQNLKYLIVYPFVTCANNTGSAENDGLEDGSGTGVLDTTSPEYITCASEASTFKDMVSKKVTSYKQKKRLLQILQTNTETFKEIEAKLISGAQLSASEQAKYDANSGCDEEKITWLQTEIKAMVDEGKLTNREKEDLLESITTNIQSITAEIEEATKDNKAKKVEKLTAKREASSKRREFVGSIEPIRHRLVHGEKIQKNYLALFPLQALEDKGRSMSLTLADLKTLESKGDIEEAIRGLEYASRGWFQDEEDFQAMCEMEERAARATYAGKKKGATSASGGKKSSSSLGTSKMSSSGGRTGSSSSGWATASNAKKSVGGKSGGGVATGGGAKKSGTGMSSFAAAFADSDSDD
mmetsp:Transcript_18382/g.30807  ORF Transcript_18382/g.30807 Transcript_18382/m.30807 type:complete len:464 (+) Transcript_18382:108-1499(+)